jgi:hypothetical protein
MARAHQVAESSRRGQELEWDGDSDLLVLASVMGSRGPPIKIT